MSNAKGDNMSEFWARFIKAQSEFPPIPKDSTATVKGKTKDGRSYEYDYKYASLPAIMDAVRPVLSANGLCLTHWFDGCGNLVTAVRDSAGEGIESAVECSDHGLAPQDWGKKVTYYRRYSAVALLGLAPDDDDDAASIDVPAAPARGQSQAPPPAPEDEYQIQLRELFDEGVGGLVGYVDDPKAEMKARMLRLLGNHGYERAGEVPRGSRGAFLADLRATVDEIKKASEQ
jgi:hypothetical protein